MLHKARVCLGETSDAIIADNYKQLDTLRKTHGQSLIGSYQFQRDAQGAFIQAWGPDPSQMAHAFEHLPVSQVVLETEEGSQISGHDWNEVLGYLEAQPTPPGVTT